MAKSGHRTAVVERKLIGGPGPVTVSFRDLTTPQHYERLREAATPCGNAVWIYVGSLTSSRPLQPKQSSHRRSSR
jgi:hypothetical protein